MDLKDYKALAKKASYIKTLAIRYFNNVRPKDREWLYDHFEMGLTDVTIFYDERVGNAVFRSCMPVPAKKLLGRNRRDRGGDMVSENRRDLSA